MSKKTHRGSDFRDFLKEQGILGEVEARALKQVKLNQSPARIQRTPVDTRLPRKQVRSD